MEQVGYDTYCNLLDEVIKEMQGIQVEEEKDIQIDIKESIRAFNENFDKSIDKAIRILPSKNMEGFFVAKIKKM